MNWPDVALVVATSAATSFLVTCRQYLGTLLPRRRPRPVDPDLMADILRNATRSASNGQQPGGTPPSAPNPPVP